MRLSLRERLARPPIMIVPGTADALGARLIEEAGFDAVYLSGAAVSYSLLGRPDVGLVTQSQMAERLAHVARAVELPVIADGDNGHGDAPQVHRTVELFEQAGAAAIQLEDQMLPKRCGHLTGKRVVARDEMVGKLRAALDARSSDEFLIIARTDARAPLGLAEAIERARSYADAGADLLFVEAPESVEELEAIAKALRDVPLVANMVEGGKTPLLKSAALAELGFRLVLYPNSLIRCFAATAQRLFSRLRAEGSTREMLDQMMLFEELNRLLGAEEIAELERRFLPKESS